ncbi:COP9 signalosome complex subunit 3 [Nannizzia gypsea CBS 118893]|uniref:COP9 signalosome complex subunit 3 n=1 Tax=Arthroderma gypseum (strain ATCC MYA-4604 / CBS 118893) TaxID=535722 RepID=E5QYN9_ARTGP|nr:COP9 signalosome complex subunit 3 [Nannizzia gypsea CBS 118893]EFQ98902.1 COP9 signalosome complex subunit 3 [Nannizzia gypsea CBS 118893]
MATQLLLSFPPLAEISDVEYDKTIRAFCVNVKKLSVNALVGSSTNGQGNNLEILDPALHSVAYLNVLLAYYQVAQKSDKSSFQPGGEGWKKALLFFETFDPIQVRYAGREFTRLVEIIASIANSPYQSLLAVQPLKNALLRLDPSCSTLTITHTLFVRTCLKANACRAALSVLEKPIFHIPASVDKTYHKRAQILPCVKDQSSSTFITDTSGLAGKITHQTYLEYYLYGAMIYMIRKEWDNALRFLHIVMAAPVTNAVSKIMVEAYKKWVLVRLLAKGQVSDLPRGIPPFAVKIYKSLSRPYEALAEIFRDGTLQRLEAEMMVGIDVWDKDGNACLVYQLPAANRRFSILKLEKVFSAISIPEIANRVSYECGSTQELEEYIASMIADGQLNARLVQASEPSGPTVLRFGKDDVSMDMSTESQLWVDLVKEKNRINAMIDNIARVDVRLELGEDYIDGLAKAQRRAGAKNRNATAFDEDLMATSR